MKSEGTELQKHFDLASWRRRIREIQTEHVTPEIIERIEQNASRQKRVAKSYKTAQFLERVNNISSASNVVTLKSMSHNPRASSVTDFGQSSNTFAARSSAILTLLSKQAAQSNDNSDDEENSEQNTRLLKLEEEIITENVGSLSSVFRPNLSINNVESPSFDIAAVGTSHEVDGLLEQFAIEPFDDAELSAKFMLFENFLANVTAIRTQLLEFWTQNKDLFLGASRIACDKDIRAIDSTDAMGIEDDGSWFVYAMTKKANQNSSAITQTLAMLRSRLELLSQELGECPCCLDSLVADRTTTLGCCHKVCSECWEHWVALKGGDAFCPLCKHKEFMEEVVLGFN